MRKYVTIEGVRHILQDGDSDVPSALIASTRTRVQCIQTLEQGRRELDMVARKAKGGGLRLRLVDDDSHTLRSIFTMRKRRATFISANVAAGGTTITVKNTSLFPSAGDLWVAGECISYTGKTATTFTGCTRGAYGTRARALRGGTNNGQAVYVSPPSWIGRIVTLKGYFLEYDGGDPTSTDMQETLGTFELDAPPQYIGGDVWELSAVDRIDGYLKKGLYVGVQPTTSSSLLQIPPSQSSSSATILLTNAERLSLFGSDTDSDPGDYAWVRLDGIMGMFNMLVRATDLDTGATVAAQWDAEVEVDYAPELNRSLEWVAPPGVDRTDLSAFTSARPVAYLREKASSIALKVLTSRTGGAANGANDVLLGRNAETSADTEPDLLAWRIGAAITAADVDTASFSAVGARTDWFYLVDEPTTVGDFLHDFCLCTDSFVCTNTAGQLSVKSMSDSKSNVIASTITSADVHGTTAVKASYDEENVFPNIQLECSYDSRTGIFWDTIESHDNEMAERFPQRDKALKIKSKSIMVAGLWADDFWIEVPSIPIEEVRARLRRYQCDEGGRGAIYLEVRVHLDHALLDIGDIVTVTAADVPDMEGATISAKRARIVGILPDWAGDAVDLKLQILRGPKLISPAAIIDSVAGNVLNLHNTAPEMGSGGAGGLSFGIGNHVIIWDVSGNQSFATTLVDASAGNVELAALPGAFTIQDDVDFITMGVASTNDTNTTQNGYTPSSDFIFQVDDDETDYEADLTGNGESRWR